MRTSNIVLFIFFLSCYNIFGEVPDTINIASIPRPLSWENHPIDFRADKNSITITAGESTDMYRAPDFSWNTDNAPQLLFEADEDFVLTASIQHDFKDKWDAGALIIKQDSLNYVKYCFEKDYEGAKRVVSVVTQQFSDDCNSMAINSNKIFYRVTKAGNFIMMFYSVNGRNWYMVRAVRMDFKGKVKAGFLAQSPNGKMNTVTFSDIKYEVKKVTSPYVSDEAEEK
jgi:regulation of enolase protein 1 (concanavalin A-like superfamily)